ncbi:hypothetical protein [Methylobacterium platani]|uniref:hypothetical protein n=1 Tax=Methylobacterium platani TaxID=427683 RepID=UPI000A4FA516|nr:hypothetical protein [Methylobacterium platani]
MARTKGRRRLTCHHEAGHALTRWYFGHKTDRALVLTVDEVRAGKTARNRKGVVISGCEGIVEGYDIHGYPYGPMLTTGSAEEQTHSNYLSAINRDVELINCFAGITAEAHYRHASVNACILAGGIQDMIHARCLVDAWDLPYEEQQALLRLSELRAIALVQSKPGAAAIKAIADALMERGRLTGEQIARLCRKAYDGRECAHSAWNAHWPATPKQIRAGFIPERLGQVA